MSLSNLRKIGGTGIADVQEPMPGMCHRTHVGNQEWPEVGYLDIRVFEQDVYIWGARLHNHDHLGACQRLEAVQIKGVRFQQLYACAAQDWRELCCNGMQGMPAQQQKA